MRVTESNREFVYEASSQIEQLSDGFVELQREGFDRATLDELFRHAHTLKGNCTAEGFSEPAVTAHALEDLLDGLRTRPEAFEAAYVDTALEALDVLERQLMDLQTTGSVETDAERIVASIRDLVPDSADVPRADDDDGAVAFDDIEMPSVDADADVSVEEALENAAVFDDLEELEGNVDTGGFDDVEGVGLFEADDEATQAGDDDAARTAGDEPADSEPVVPAGDQSADDRGADASASRSATAGVESSTRRDSEVVPGEDSYAELLSDTPLADPDELQSDLEDVTFGEFDDDDDLSIGDLVDLADESAGSGRTDANVADEPPIPDRESAEDAASGRGDAGTAVDPTHANVADADAVETADADAVDAGSSTRTTSEGDDDPGSAREEDVFSLGDPSTETESPVEAVADEPDSTADASADDGTAFEFGTADAAEEVPADAASSRTDADSDDGAESSASGDDPAVEPLDLDPGGDPEVASPEPDPSDGADGASDDVEDAAATDADASTVDPAVVDIVDRIERLDEAEPVGETVDSDDGPTDSTPVDGETTAVDSIDFETGDDASSGVEVTGVEFDDVGEGADEVSDVLDAASETAADDREILPSDVPDVDSILEETEFEDVADVEFATAEFYDRVGFETDSSTGAFVSEFGEAFDEDATSVDGDAGGLSFDAASTIDPSLLDADAADDDGGSTSMETVREVSLDVEEADELLELAEELVVDTSRLAGALSDLPPGAADALASLRDVSARIEDTVSNVRLVPLDAAFSGLSRTGRRVAREQDTDVTVRTENGGVEVDRRIVDELADPLVHLVRNAVDHGLEPPEERVASGKSPEGTVLVRAERNGDTVTVAVEDDGRGADPDDLRAAAVDAGLYTTAEANALSRDDALELMFHAGLSTTEVVSEVSGRGVGMDVVSDVVTRLEGTLDVQSEPGVGTTVALTLPVSVALSDVLTVAVGSRRVGLPATDVRRVEEYVPGRVDGNGYRLLTGDDEITHVPIVDLSAALDVDPRSRSGPARTDVLVLTDDPEPRALRCQDVVDWESVVLQPFDGVLADDALARGAALAGDGTPVVVLEPAELGDGR